VAADRSFQAEASLGKNENGARQHFDIFILAHRDPKRFGAWDILSDIPSECEPPERRSAHPICLVSAVVTVFRSR
jgi:hypothetical protein